MKKRLLSALLAGSMMLTMAPSTLAYDQWLEEADGNTALTAVYSNGQGSTKTRYFDNTNNDDYAQDPDQRDHIWDVLAVINGYEELKDHNQVEITLNKDIVLEDTTILVESGVDVTIKGAGHKIDATLTGDIEAGDKGAHNPGMDAVSIVEGGSLTLENVTLNISKTGAGENATQGIYNDGTLNLGQDATVTIDGVSQNGINGEGIGALNIENAELTVQNVTGTAVKAGATIISNSTVSVTGTGAHGISVTDLTVTGNAAVTVDDAAYYGVRASGDVSMSGENTKVTVKNSSNDTIEGEEGEPTTFSEIVLGSDSTSTISLTGTISGEDIQVLGNGKTTVDGAAITGNVTNAGTGAMTIANSAISGNLASETGTVTLKGTTVSGTQTGKIEVESPYTITAANLHDTEGAVADGQLYENGSYDVNVTWNAEDEAYDVAISAENVRIHKNAAGNYGAWVGFAVEAPEGAVTVDYVFATDENGEKHTRYAVEDLGDGKKGIAFYVNAAAETPNLYASVKWDNEETTTVYHIDLAGVTVSEEATTVSSITVQEKVADAYTTSATMSAAVGENNTIAVTGLTAGEDKTINLVLNTNAGGQVTKEVALTYTAETGFATEDKVTVAGVEYTIDVSGLAALPADVEIEAGEPQTSVSDAIPEEQQEAVKTALTQTTVDAAPVAQAANAQITEIAQDLDVEALLAQANEAEPDKYNTIKVVTYLEVSATGYTTAGEGTEAALTLEITPKYQVIATNGIDDSAPLGSGDLTVETTTEPVEITIGLPEGFVTGTTNPVYIYHEKAENTYVYAAKVEGTDSFTATFTNPHGFSTFVVKTSAAASITNANGEVTYYATLQDAVDSVENNGTITLLADGLEATVSRTISFKVASVDGQDYTCTITAGQNTTGGLNEGTGSYEFEYTSPLPPTDDSGSSGGSGSTTYAVSVETATNGTVSVSPRNASKGATVTITVTPNEGYVLGTLTATDANGDTISLSNEGDGKYTFTMPASRVTVSATFVAESEQELPFTDVASSEWYYEAVQYVYNNELMNGMSATTFEPNSTTTRGMIVTMLYRLENEPTAASAGFSDVAEGQWYTDAVNWAAANNIVNGYGDDQFGPTDTITREQMMAILYRYAQYKGYDVTASADLSAYTDAANISSYAVSAMQWAVGEGLINGITDTTLVPGGSATRAQVAAILMRFCENVAK